MLVVNLKSEGRAEQWIEVDIFLDMIYILSKLKLTSSFDKKVAIVSNGELHVYWDD